MMRQKIIYRSVSVLLLIGLLIAAACSKNEEQKTVVTAPNQLSSGTFQSPLQGTESAMDINTLDKIAELERSGRYTPGLGFAESTIKERSGDYAGAVIGAYKEMTWTYALADTTAENSIAMDQIREGLYSILDLYGGEIRLPAEDIPDMREDPQQNARVTVTALLYFLDNRWMEAGDLLDALFSDDEEIDSFAQWLILACALEQKDASRTVRSLYGAMRSRYEYFPEYWYRLARYVDDDAAKMDASERCIVLAPKGPYASECRSIIAEIFNIDTSQSDAMLTRAEIENAVTSSVSSRNPELLRQFFPLLELPDNPFTMYAVGALRALSAEPLYKDFFLHEASLNGGRLNERLVYISRG